MGEAPQGTQQEACYSPGKTRQALGPRREGGLSALGEGEMLLGVPEQAGEHCGELREVDFVPLEVGVLWGRVS